ncbi:MAG: RNB domain-containing ribonuclease [Phycisphaera sp. TMED24]|nr:MAG: RNB domain-containing ribonuclease [Phycisphaera sp. TMED24]|tara:strand:+ start:977 stop:2608 length:1632 start_codon:yes stop_codon:yes gene_type:complete
MSRRAVILSCPWRKIGYAETYDDPFTLLIIPKELLEKNKLIPGSSFRYICSDRKNIKNVPSCYLDRNYMAMVTTCEDIKQPLKVPILVGILFLSGKYIYGANKKGMIKYIFQPENNNYPRYIVASRLGRGGIDYYVRVEPQPWVDVEIPSANCIENIGEIDKCDYNEIIAEKYFLRLKPKPAYSLPDITFMPLYYGTLFSIDPVNCRDIDDVIGWKRTDEYTEVSIHIAHVTAVPHPEFVINQTVTIYPPDKPNYNLLPNKIAEDGLSLVPGKRRNVLSLLLRWDNKNGFSQTVREHSIINERALTYDEAEIDMEYLIVKEWVEKKLFNEVLVDSHAFIEKLMIYTNSYIAERLTEVCSNDAILRVTSGNMERSPALYMLNSDCIIQKRSSRHIHLSKEYYTHFTSPLRRAVDQDVHNLVRKYILNDLSVKDLDLCKRRYRLRKYNMRLEHVRFAETEWFWLQKYNEGIVNFEALVINIQQENILELLILEYDKRITILYNNTKTLEAADLPECLWKTGDKCIIKLLWDKTLGLRGKRFYLEQ